eukprot:gene12057-biopygen9877
MRCRHCPRILAAGDRTAAPSVKGLWPARQQRCVLCSCAAPGSGRPPRASGPPCTSADPVAAPRRGARGAFIDNPHSNCVCRRSARRRAASVRHMYCSDFTATIRWQGAGDCHAMPPALLMAQLRGRSHRSNTQAALRAAGAALEAEEHRAPDPPLVHLYRTLLVRDSGEVPDHDQPRAREQLLPGFSIRHETSCHL